MIHATTASRGDEAGLRDLSRDEPSQGAAAGGAQETPTVDPPFDPCIQSQQQVCPVPSRRSLLCLPVCIRRVIEYSGPDPFEHHPSIVVVKVLPRFPKALVKNSFIPSLPDRKRLALSPFVRPSSA